MSKASARRACAPKVPIPTCVHVCHSSFAHRPATGERKAADEDHIYDDPPEPAKVGGAGAQGQPSEDAIYEEFPEEKLKNTASKPSMLLYEAIYDYDGQAEGDLTFKAGDVIEVYLCACAYFVFDLL